MIKKRPVILTNVVDDLPALDVGISIFSRSTVAMCVGKYGKVRDMIDEIERSTKSTPPRMPTAIDSSTISEAACRLQPLPRPPGAEPARSSQPDPCISQYPLNKITGLEVNSAALI